ncbi:glycosyltransferase 87 family protein [Streptomyces violens]|uniref:glycosyltransferase 87 family protein n=1 Tax=Streptomyces violens TaxID=66377 RepID=UPI00248027A8|nr:glycosyltransferase 87 family protein [Streptomyces violens]
MLAVSVAALGVVHLFVPMPTSDILVYRAMGDSVLTGGDLYGFTVTEWHLPATYPPFAALLFVPLARISPGVLELASVLANIALLALLIHFSARLAGLRVTHRVPSLLVATALAIWLEPVYQTIVFGQINLALACLVLWDLTRPDGARGKGLAIGIAAGIKLTPALFAVYLLLTGRVRAALVSLAGFAGTVLLGIVALPGASVEFWTQRLYETGRVGEAWIVDNQSLQGLLARLLHTTHPGAVWLAGAVLTAVIGMAAARRTGLVAGREAWGVLCTALTALLVSPISWSHHWVWCVPLLAVLATHIRRDAWRRTVWAVLAVAFTARTMWLVPHKDDLDLALPWWQQPLAAPYPLLGVAFLLAAVFWRGGVLTGVAAGALIRPGAAGRESVPAPRAPS